MQIIDSNVEFIPHTYPNKQKYTILGFSCISLIIISYCFSEFMSVHQSLQYYFIQSKVVEDASSFEVFFNMVISIASVTSIAFSLFNGYVVDQFGYQLSVKCIAGSIIIGQSLIFIGLNNLNISCVLIGRVIFIVCQENIPITLCKLIRKYFDGSHGNFAFANSVMLMLRIFGSILNSFIAPQICGAMGLLQSAMIPLILSVVACLVLSILLVYDGITDQEIPSEQLFKELDVRQPFSLKGYWFILNDATLLIVSIAISKGLGNIFAALASGIINEYWGIEKTDQFYMQQTIDAQMVGLFQITMFILMTFFGYIVNKFEHQRIMLLKLSTGAQLAQFSLFLLFKPIFTMPLLGIVFLAFSSRQAILAPLISQLYKQQLAEGLSLCLFSSEGIVLLLSLLAGWMRTISGGYVSFVLLLVGLQAISLTLLYLFQKKRKEP